jgi:hypothetical protein
MKKKIVIFVIAPLIVAGCALSATNTIRGTSPHLMTYHIKHPRPAAYSYTGGRRSLAKREPIVKELSVPHGATNVAINKAVSASDIYPIIGELSFLTDGKTSGKDKAILEIAPGKQWVQIDLDETCEVYAIAMWRHVRTWGPKVYRDVVILLSDDAQCTNNVRTIFNNDHDAVTIFSASIKADSDQLRANALSLMLRRRDDSTAGRA